MDFNTDGTDGEWPVFKGESFDIWENDRGPGTYYAWAEPSVVNPWLQQRRLRSRDGAQAEISLEQRRDERTLAPHRARLAFRDITNRTNQRTVIASLIPPNVFLTNKAPHLLRIRGDERDEAFLLGVLCSRSLDWYARRFVELSLNFFIFNPFPVPRPSHDNPLWQRVVALSGRLAAPDERFADWADAVGVECGPIDPTEKQAMIDELDAVVAHLYGLDADQLTHIFETFHEGWDYQPRLDAVLDHFHRVGEDRADA